MNLKQARQFHFRFVHLLHLTNLARTVTMILNNVSFNTPVSN